MKLFYCPYFLRSIDIKDEYELDEGILMCNLYDIVVARPNFTSGFCSCFVL